MFVVSVDCSPAAGDTHVAVSKSYLHVLCTDSDTQQGQTTDMTTTHFLRVATLLAGTGMTAAAFCDDYAASDCADAFTDCSGAYAAMDTTTQACVATHLGLVDASDSAHCAHARGEGPCEPADDTAADPVKSSSGASLGFALSLLMAVGLVHNM